METIHLLDFGKIISRSLEVILPKHLKTLDTNRVL